MSTVPCVMTDYHGHVQELTSPQDAADWFDEQAAPSGREEHFRAGVPVSAARTAVTEFATSSSKPAPLR